MQKKLKNNEIDDFEVTQRNQTSKDKGLSKSPGNAKPEVKQQNDFLKRLVTRNKDF